MAHQVSNDEETVSFNADPSRTSNRRSRIDGNGTAQPLTTFQVDDRSDR